MHQSRRMIPRLRLGLILEDEVTGGIVLDGPRTAATARPALKPTGGIAILHQAAWRKSRRAGVSIGHESKS